MLPNGQTGGQTGPGTGPVTVHLVTGPIHYDFLLPADAATRAAFGFANAAGLPMEAEAVEWLVVGWGAEAFYTQTGTWRDLKPGPLWKAVTGDASVLRVALAGRLGDLPVQSLHLTHAEYHRLREAILQSLAQPAKAAPGHGDWDRFFAAKGRFHLLRTCNVWIGDVMERAGLRFGRWTPLPFAVTLSLRVFQGGG